MARKVTVRTVANKAALGAISRGLAEGMAAVGRAIIATADVPDAAPFGEGLVTTGDWGVWAGTRKVDGTATKPRTVRTRAGVITLVAGFGFPGRFQEFGTVHHAAQPFLTPAVLEVTPTTEAHLRAPVRRALASVR